MAGMPTSPLPPSRAMFGCNGYITLAVSGASVWVEALHHPNAKHGEKIRGSYLTPDSFNPKKG